MLSLLSRFIVIMISSIFLLEIWFLSYNSEFSISQQILSWGLYSKVHPFSFPKDRRKTAPEIRKSIQFTYNDLVSFILVLIWWIGVFFVFLYSWRWFLQDSSYILGYRYIFDFRDYINQYMILSFLSRIKCRYII